MIYQLSSLFVSGCLLATAAPTSIGSIKSSGEFRLDNSMVSGNSTLCDGDVIETTAARSVVDLNGVQITLSPNSRAKVYRDHTILENGTGLVSHAGNHVIEAATLRIVSATNGSVLQVETSGPKHVVIAARSGSAEVRNATGVLIASVRTGMPLAFDPQAGATAATHMTGILSAVGDKFFLTDAITNVRVELRGTGLAKLAGKKISITGSIMNNAVAASGASEVIQVTSIDVAGAAGAAGAGAAGTAGAAAGGGGLSTAATVAIVAGVGVAGGVAGLAITGTFSGSSSVSPQ